MQDLTRNKATQEIIEKGLEFCVQLAGGVVGSKIANSLGNSLTVQISSTLGGIEVAKYITDFLKNYADKEKYAKPRVVKDLLAPLAIYTGIGSIFYFLEK